MRQHVIRLVVGLAALLGALEPLPAQTQRGVTAAALPSRVRAEAGFDWDSSAGLFVGVRAFDDDQLAEIPYAVDDAVDLAHLFAVELELIHPNRVVLALSGDPQKEESVNRLATLLERGASRVTPAQSELYRQLGTLAKNSGPDGLFVVSMATHGFSDQGSQYMASSDTLKRRVTQTSIAAHDLFDDVERAKAPRRLVLLDACRERLSAGTRSGEAEKASAMKKTFVDALAAAEGQVVLTGTTLGGYSYDDPERKNGVFTGAILDGLRGSAPPDEAGLITASGLFEYADQRVRSWIQDNRPEHLDVSKGIQATIDSASGRMPLAFDHRGATEKQGLQREEALRLLSSIFAQSNTLSAETVAFVKDRLRTEEGEALDADQLKLLGFVQALEPSDGRERAETSLELYVQSLESGKRIATDESVRKTILVVSRPEARYGVPDADQYLVNRGHIIGYSYSRRQPLWALELRHPRQFTDETEGARVDRVDNFREDLRIREEFRAYLSDYRGSGFDRGHLVSSSNQRGTRILNSEIFLMSNLTPQRPRFNRQIWRLLEEAVRDLIASAEYDELYILSGPVFPAAASLETIGDNRIPVPSAFFKSVLAERVVSADNPLGQLKLWTFLVPNEGSDEELASFLRPTTEVEQLTGLSLWDQLRGNDADVLRTKREEMWSLSEPSEDGP